MGCGSSKEGGTPPAAAVGEFETGAAESAMPSWAQLNGRRGPASKEPRDRILHIVNRSVVVTKTLVICIHELGELGVRHVGDAGRKCALAYRLMPLYDAERRSFKRDEVAPAVKKKGAAKVVILRQRRGPEQYRASEAEPFGKDRSQI